MHQFCRSRKKSYSIKAKKKQQNYSIEQELVEKNRKGMNRVFRSGLQGTTNKPIN